MKATISGSSNSGEISEGRGGHGPCVKGAARVVQKKEDILKIKCFRCGEMGHYNTQCPLKKKDKEGK